MPDGEHLSFFTKRRVVDSSDKLRGSCSNLRPCAAFCPSRSSCSSDWWPCCPLCPAMLGLRTGANPSCSQLRCRHWQAGLQSACHLAGQRPPADGGGKTGKTYRIAVGFPAPGDRKSCYPCPKPIRPHAAADSFSPPMPPIFCGLNATPKPPRPPPTASIPRLYPAAVWPGASYVRRPVWLDSHRWAQVGYGLGGAGRHRV